VINLGDTPFLFMMSIL